MRILVASGFEAGVLWAHAINTVKMAEGFALLGHDVRLVCRRPRTRKVDASFLADTYGLEHDIEWAQIAKSRYLRGSMAEWRFALGAIRQLRRFAPDLVFSRSYIFPVVTTYLGYPTVVESHAHPDNASKDFAKLVRASSRTNLRLWVTISKRLSAHYRSLGVPDSKLVVLADAVDTRLFARPSRLPESPYASSARPVVAYAGHLYDYKGIPTVLNAAKRSPEVEFHLIGGAPQDLSRQRTRIEEEGLANVTLHGLRPHADIPPYLWHADVLLLPPSLHHPSAMWTSPVKLGEYLVSGTPVVATRIPALEDWLSAGEVCFVEPDDADALADGIRTVLQDRDYARSLVERGLAKGSAMTYEARAREVLERAVP